MDRLLDSDALEASSVVANRAMNRERQLDGVNSYARELGFNPVEWIIERIGRADPATRIGWLDLCCGSGRPLIQASERLRRGGFANRAALVGVDLVDFFDPVPEPATAPELVCASVVTWQPERRYDLITCVHGLHYLGDKLGVLARAAGWLTDGGLLVVDLDLASIRRPDGRPLGRPLTAALRSAGFRYDPRRRRLSGTGPLHVSLPYAYLGADDRAGPNYTGQPAVDAYYAVNPGRGRDVPGMMSGD